MPGAGRVLANLLAHSMARYKLLTGWPKTSTETPQPQNSRLGQPAG